MKLHASGEDYLETILVLQKKLGMVRSVDVARHMEVSKPSVCHAVATLRDGGFLTMLKIINSNPHIVPCTFLPFSCTSNTQILIPSTNQISFERTVDTA